MCQKTGGSVHQRNHKSGASFVVVVLLLNPHFTAGLCDVFGPWYCIDQRSWTVTWLFFFGPPLFFFLRTTFFTTSAFFIRICAFFFGLM
jgi:hypothetical protein